MKNAELIVRLLEQAGVRWVFGVPSGPVLPLIEALRQSDVDFVLTASETSAGFMATTVGQLTGKPGVCVSTVGPGATNLATGVGAAWLDGAPVLAITCNVPTPWLDRRIQMRIDHHALFRPLTKATIPLRADNVGASVSDAIALAMQETPGPVHLDLPEDVAVATAVEGAARNTPPVRLMDISREVVSAVEPALRAARRPIVVTGLAFARSRAADRLLTFVERQNLPVISTLHGKGMLPESHANWCGVLGRARRSDVQAFVNRADLVLAIGYDPIELNYEEWIGHLPLIHVSMEVADVGPEVDVRLNVGGDMDGALVALAQLAPIENDWTADDFAHQRRALDAALRPDDGTFGSHHVIDALRERLAADAILAYDVGAHTHQIATQWRTDRPGTCLATNGWSSMGFGMPAAYAAKLVHPDRTVVGVVGDGCFQMTVGELAVARRLNLRVPIVVLNDGWLGLMKVKQERKSYPLSGVYLGDPVPSPSHYFGVPCRSAANSAEFRAALDWALALDGPSVIEAFIDVTSYSATVFD
jgi:acetolactate synthase-1/2/3 large subunit